MSAAHVIPRYRVALDASGAVWIVEVADTPAIGPFGGVAEAERALAELEAAAQREVTQ